jgi:hypothetical protein
MDYLFPHSYCAGVTGAEFNEKNAVNFLSVLGGHTLFFPVAAVS